MFGEFYHKYGFVILFVGAIIVIVLTIGYKLIYGGKGSFMNHSKLMWQLLARPTETADSVIENKKSRDSKGETECRRVIENLTGESFPKQRPDFLRNTMSNHNLELDCFNQKLRLAVEYNGEQHYKYNPYFHRTEQDFYDSQYRDKLKIKLCEQNNIKLIVVPYTIALNQIERYILEKLNNFGFKQ
jgi:hypothetical protein